VTVKKGRQFFEETPQNWQTVTTKNLSFFSGKNRGDTLSCRPGWCPP